jgi:cyclopropane fatty-acyl-phospholipid synthase-like methyltransferase
MTTTPGEQIAASWRDEAFVHEWTSNDSLETILALPRTLAATVVSTESPDAHRILDIGSGPGAFLAAFLEAFPDAVGIWADASDAMMHTARERLAKFGERVTYVIADMTDLGASAIPQEVDVVVTSRASHHLDPDRLTHFYRDVRGYLSAGGWMVNLDHVGLGEPWQDRMRSARKKMIGARPDGQLTHYHSGPTPTISEHISSYKDAGFQDVDTPWRAFGTCLFMGQTSTS